VEDGLLLETEISAQNPVNGVLSLKISHPNHEIADQNLVIEDQNHETTVLNLATGDPNHVNADDLVTEDGVGVDIVAVVLTQVGLQ